MQHDAKRAIAMSSLVLYLTCLGMNVNSKKTKKRLPALSSHGTHKCSSQTLAPTLCTPQVREEFRECLIAAEECEAHLVHSPQRSQRKCGF